MLIGTNHVGFTVSDLDRSIAFYTELLGEGPYFRELFETEWIAGIVGYPGAKLDIALFRLPKVDTVLELLQYIVPPGSRVDMETNNTGIAHLCLNVDDLDAEYARMQQAGARFRSASPVTIETGPFRGARAVYFRDPDGITIEMIQPPAP
jgi:catechol 2,3-dioxygenase-like lactoylglutathione lyase family enzyme